MTSLRSAIDSAITIPSQVARSLLEIGGNRLQLAGAELREGQFRLLGLVSLALGITTLAMLASLCFVAAVVLAYWPNSTVMLLFGLAAGFALLAVGLALFLILRARKQAIFAASIDQLRKDRDQLAAILS